MATTKITYNQETKTYSIEGLSPALLEVTHFCLSKVIDADQYTPVISSHQDWDYWGFDMDQESIFTSAQNIHLHLDNYIESIEEMISNKEISSHLLNGRNILNKRDLEDPSLLSISDAEGFLPIYFSPVDEDEIYKFCFQDTILDRNIITITKPKSIHDRYLRYIKMMAKFKDAEADGIIGDIGDDIEILKKLGVE